LSLDGMKALVLDLRMAIKLPLKNPSRLVPLKLEEGQ
jgi:hypothetical protein